MNFLAHFFLDIDQPNGYFAAGAATPDLLSIYNPGLRIKAGQLGHLPPSIRAQADPHFVAGLERHFHADRVFHSSGLFRTEMHELSVLLKRQFHEQDIPRKFFVAHILIELLLDKVLIQQHPGLLDDYYRQFESLSPFRRLRQSTELVSGHSLPNYESFLAKFVENKYLYHYTENDHLVYILRRLLRRVGIWNHGFLDDARFPVLMEEFEARIGTYFGRFFEEIRANE
ncbi:MAG: hypothetical protein RLZZ165_623 [Bacteroidota bacterium]|jgi:hypothetical protein